MKNVLVIAGLAVLALGLIWMARINSAAGPESFANSALELVSENNVDFGTISMADGDVFRSYFLKNGGNEPVLITKIWTSCMCTEAVLKTSSGEERGRFGMHGPEGPNFEVPPGETVEIEAVYDPNAHGPAGVGPIARSIFVETNSSTNPKLELKFKGVVTE